MRTNSQILAVCNQVYRALCKKNASYGDSALNPLAIFGDGDPIKGLCARIDDKLARVKNAPDAYGEDVISDLIGYLILLKIAKGKK